MSNGTVLLVDDEPRVTEALARILRTEHFETKSASTADEAIALLVELPFDVVCSDIRMPKTDGLQLMRAVRAHDPDVPVVFLTGAPSLDTAIRAVELGAFRYLTKPIDADELVGVVGMAVRLARLARLKREAQGILGGDCLAPGDLSGLGHALDLALASMYPAFQAVVHATSGDLYGYEALMRSDEKRLPDPGAVIEAARRLDRLDDIGRTMRDLSAAKVDLLPAHARLFVNLHPVDLLDPHLTSRASPLTRHAERVVLEITERASLEGLPHVQSSIETLRSLGFSIAIDDLGAGYSGLCSFATLLPDIVKIDMSLIRDIDAQPVKQRLVAALVEACHDLDAIIVAEGIETKAERTTTTKLGCDLLQGYLIARPGPLPPIH